MRFAGEGDIGGLFSGLINSQVGVAADGLEVLRCHACQWAFNRLAPDPDSCSMGLCGRRAKQCVSLKHLAARTSDADAMFAGGDTVQLTALVKVLPTVATNKRLCTIGSSPWHGVIGRAFHSHQRRRDRVNTPHPAPLSLKAREEHGILLGVRVANNLAVSRNTEARALGVIMTSPV